jgi:exonuclease III
MIRIATWNMQTIFPIRSDGKWEYLRDNIRPDIAVLTEAKPEDVGYQLLYREGGLGKRRRWGTIVATKPEFKVTELTVIKTSTRTRDLIGTWPGSVVIADIVTPAGTEFTLVGLYAVTTDLSGKNVGHGHYTTRAIANEITPLFYDGKRRNVVLAGDLNMLPPGARSEISLLPLVDLIQRTASSRPPNHDCACEDPKPTGHIWTHRNKSAKTKEQQVDYLFATRPMAERLLRIEGGPGDFPDIWEWSDHAPLVAELDI